MKTRTRGHSDSVGPLSVVQEKTTALPRKMSKDQQAIRRLTSMSKRVMQTRPSALLKRERMEKTSWLASNHSSVSKTKTQS